MSSKYHKGQIDIRNIVAGSGVTKVGVYKDFPKLESTNYANMRPLPLNYSNSSGDLSNVATASNESFNITSNSTITKVPDGEKYTTVGTTTISVPHGAKAIRYVTLSGGGGQGGNGGSMKMTNNDNFWGTYSCTANGGTGAIGGCGFYTYSNGDIISIGGAENIDITVGAGGFRGNNGSNGSSKNKSGAKAPDGNNGGAGGSSYIKVGSRNYIGRTVGGNGGQKGFGGTGYAGQTSVNCYKGGDGNAENSNQKQGNQENDWPLFDNTNVGTGGTGSGNDGQVRIIWLFGD